MIRGSLHWHIRPSATGEKRYPALNRKVAGTVSDRRVRMQDVAWVEEGVAAQRALRQAARQLRALHGQILAQAARLHTALLYDYEPRAAKKKTATKNSRMVLASNACRAAARRGSRP